MSRQNTVEIIVKSKDATDAGFAAARKSVGKHTEAIKKDLDKSEEYADKAGTRAGTKLKKQIVDNAKGTGKKVGEDLSDEINKVVAARARVEAKSAGRNWGVEFGANAVSTVGAALATPLGAGAAAAGVAFAGGVVGGLATAFVGAGAVGLGAYLLKDNKEVNDTWSKTFKTIADDSVKAAGVMADEFVAAGKKTADIWRQDVKPQVEGIFIAAQPLVDKFTTGLGKSVADFLPGIKTAVANSGPAVEGFLGMVDSLLKGTGDGLADLSGNSEDLGKTLKFAGDAGGGAIKGVLGFMGDLSKAFAENEDDARRWAKTIKEEAKASGEDLINLVKLGLKAGGDPDEFYEAARTFLESGEDKFDRNKPDPDNNLALLLPGPGGHALKAGLDARDYKQQHPTPESVKLVTDAYKSQDEAASKLTASLDVLNQSKTFGIEVTDQELNKADGLMAKQAELATSIQTTAKVTGDQTSANYTALTSMLEIAAAGMPVHASLMQIVSGMTDAQLAALGATVTTDGLGNSIISIPGHKPITITADASQANPPLDGVINRISQVQSKTVTIRVNSVYSSTGGAGSVNGQTVFHDQYNKGGWVGGAGGDYDSVPAMLTPKEFVVTRKAAEKHGPLLEKINQSAGGSLQLAGVSGGGGGQGGGRSAAGVQEVRVVFDVRGASDGMFLQLLKGAIREHGGNPSVLGGGGR